MNALNRRSLLMALAAVSLSGCGSAPATLGPDHLLSKGLDPQGVADIAATYLAKTTDPVSESKVRHLFVSGELQLAALQKAIQADFRNKRVFKHKGWFLSHTEGQLFTLLTRTSDQ